MVLNEATGHGKMACMPALTPALMPVDGYETAEINDHESDISLPPVFILGDDDDDYEDEDDYDYDDEDDDSLDDEDEDEDEDDEEDDDYTDDWDEEDDWEDEDE